MIRSTPQPHGPVKRTGDHLFHGTRWVSGEWQMLKFPSVCELTTGRKKIWQAVERNVFLSVIRGKVPVVGDY